MCIKKPVVTRRKWFHFERKKKFLYIISPLKQFIRPQWLIMIFNVTFSYFFTVVAICTLQFHQNFKTSERLLDEEFIINEMVKLLPPANEVCEGYVFTRVCLSTGGWYPSMPCRFPGPHPGGKLRGLAWGDLLPGGCGDPPHDGYCCRQYTSYWNAFLFFHFFPTLHL